MKTKIISLSVEVKPSGSHLTGFNETRMKSIITDLRIHFDEVFIWPVKSRLAVWVMGCSNCEVLLNAFVQVKHLMNAKVFTDDKALHYFLQISTGKEWKEVSPVNKLRGLHLGQNMSCCQGCIGPITQLLVTNGMAQLRTHESVSGARNSYSVSSKVKDKKQVIEIAEPDLFYRFCVN